MSSSKLTSQSRLELTCVWQEALPTPDGWPNQKRQDDWHLSWISSICPSLNLSPVRRKGKKILINTPDRWLQRFSLSSAQSSTGCHSPLAAQPHLIPKGDRYSLSGFQLSEESKALPVVHSEGFWQEAVVCFWSAAHRSSGSRGRKRQGGGEAKEGGAVERPACENRLSRRLHSGNHQTAVGWGSLLFRSSKGTLMMRHQAELMNVTFGSGYR